jgi:hypothetical protein
VIWNHLLNTVGEQLKWSLEISMKAANGESIDEPEDLDKSSKTQGGIKRENVLTTAATADNICEAMEVNIIPLF